MKTDDVKSLIRFSRELFPCVVGVNDDTIRATRKAWVRSRIYLDEKKIAPRAPIATMQNPPPARKPAAAHPRPIPRYYDPDVHVGAGLALLAVFIVILVLIGELTP